MRRLMIATALLAVTALACGGDDADPSVAPSPSSASPTPSAMSKDAWVSAANAICKRVEGESEAIKDPTTAQEYVTGTKTYLDSLKKGQADLRALTPPAADAATIETNFYAVNDAQIKILEDLMPQLEAAAAKNDSDAAQKVLEDGFEKFSAAAGADKEKWTTDYGLTSCV